MDEVLAAGTGFAAMDFPTRNLYRSAIEDMARGSDLHEIAIARSAVTAASREHDDPRVTIRGMIFSPAAGRVRGDDRFPPAAALVASPGEPGGWHRRLCCSGRSGDG